MITVTGFVLSLLFNLRIVRLVGWRGLRLYLFPLFLIGFFNRPSLYWLVTLVILLIGFMASGSLYLGFGLSLGCFFD